MNKARLSQDPRSMRRIIAEDPEWNLETVPPLVDACIQHIADHFHVHPILEELLPKHKKMVLEKLSPSVPLKVTSHLVSDEDYWKKCCTTRWGNCDVSKYGKCWKRMFFEKNAQEALEKFVPDQSDLSELEELLRLSSPFIKCLDIQQLLPPPPDDKMLSHNHEDEEQSEDTPLKPCNDHINTGILFQTLKNLEELGLAYGVKNCGMNFDWGLFEFTKLDCARLSKAVGSSRTLQVLRVCCSKMADERGRVLASHILDHPSLRELDLSHNKLGDGMGRALGKLLSGRTVLTTLDLCDNLIGSMGGAAIGHALQTNTTLKHLNLRLNKLGDEGAQPIFKALMKNMTLQSLNISSNSIGDIAAPMLAEVLIANKTLTSLSIASNTLGEGSGQAIQEGMQENTVLVSFDLRLTDISQQSEYCINQFVKANQDRQKANSKLMSTSAKTNR
ncbi:hypothetical protein EMCRGX_G018796 [Ephydatia muelleri]